MSNVVNEILICIFNKLENVDVLYSFYETNNQRLEESFLCNFHRVSYLPYLTGFNIFHNFNSKSTKNLILADCSFEFILKKQIKRLDIVNEDR